MEIEDARKIIQSEISNGNTSIMAILAKLGITNSSQTYERDRKRVRDEIRRSKQPTFERALEANNHLPSENWQHGWLKTKEASVFIRNDRNDINLEEVISELFDKHITAKQTTIKQLISVEPKDTFDRLVITDVHIGLDPNKSGDSMYPMKWGVEEINQAKYSIIRTVNNSKSSNVLYFDNLGDYLDGYEGKTTRGGHSLEQNMSTEQMFTVGVEWMLELIENFAQTYEKVIVRNLCNDNHSGNFSLICGVAIQKLCELKFDNVEFINQKKFIEHYQVGSHVFLLSHGKDKSLMKYGFGSVPNKDNIHKIENYISAHKLNSAENTNIEFSKGDSHLYNADNGSSDIFAYISYPTLAPNSEWITTNFKKGKRGFVFYNIELETSNKTITPIYL